MNHQAAKTQRFYIVGKFNTFCDEVSGYCLEKHFVYLGIVRTADSKSDLIIGLRHIPIVMLWVVTCVTLFGCEDQKPEQLSVEINDAQIEYIDRILVESKENAVTFQDVCISAGAVLSYEAKVSYKPEQKKVFISNKDDVKQVLLVLNHLDHVHHFLTVEAVQYQE